jgi:Uma2 family endonuclease
LYELAKGEVVVVDVPNPEHLFIVLTLKRLLFAYDAAHPGVIKAIATGSECKILLPGDESERHPDLAVYKTAPPAADFWANWIPELVIEVVSAGSEQRDYVEKPADYLAFGVREYWIFDPMKKLITAKTRSGGRWATREIGAGESVMSRELPGFEVRHSDVFTG